MENTVWVLDTTWAQDDIKSRQRRFNSLKILATQRDIKRHLQKWSKGRGALTPNDFVFVHHSDVAEFINELGALRNRHKNIRLYSGATTSASEGILPRSIVQRQLDDFLHYWQTGDEASALRVLEQPNLLINRIRRWTDRFQHDYINLLAPIDLLSVAFAAGEIEEKKFREIHEALLEILHEKQRPLVERRRDELGNLRPVFDELVEVAQQNNPISKGTPEMIPESARLRSALPGRVLHVDDEIDNGWNLVMPELIKDYSYITDPERVLPAIHELEKVREPYLVLLDLGLQSGDSPTPRAWRGLDLLRDIRAEYPHAPVHVLSALNDAETYREVMEAGGNDFIRKPCRVLADVSDYQLYEHFRSQLLRARYDVFRAFTYRAILDLRERLAGGEIRALGSEDRSNSSSINEPGTLGVLIRQQNADLALNTLLQTDFERTTRDPKYANTVLRGLILALYRPIEPRNTGPQNDTSQGEASWKTRILKIYRNMCAHHGRSRELFTLDLRDLSIVVQVLLEPELLEAPLDDARRLFRTARGQVFQSPEARHIEQQFREVRDAGDRRLHSHLQNLLRRVPRHLTEKPHEQQEFELLALLADKLLNPDSENSEIAIRNRATLVDRPAGAYQARPASTFSASAGVSVQTPDSNGPNRRDGVRVKTLSYFVRESNGRQYIAFGNKWRDAEVDGSDPAQQDFFAWYYDKNVRGHEHKYSEDALAFMKETYGVGPNSEHADATRPSPPEQQTDSPDVRGASDGKEAHKPLDDFEIALYEITDLPQDDVVAEALRTLEKRVGQGLKDPLERRNRFFFTETSNSRGEPFLRGVELRVRRPFNSPKHYLQIQAAQTSASGSPDEVMPLTYADAWWLVSKAGQNIEWLDRQRVSASTLPSHGRLTLAGAAEPAGVEQQLAEMVKGVSIAVISPSEQASERLAKPWRDLLTKRYNFPLVAPEQADATLVVIPENSSQDVINSVFRSLKDSGKPWKVVAPTPAYKDWNVLVGLTSRFGCKREMPTYLRARDPNVIFLGLDLGHLDRELSQLAATLINTQGQLVAWTKVKNTAEGHTAEKVSFEAFSRIFSTLMPVIREMTTGESIRLVIHRDGKTLEPVDDYLTWLGETYGIEEVDWLDIDKGRAPMFQVEANEQTGHYAEFVDISGRSEIWLRTAPDKGPFYARPICLIPQQTVTDLDTLALEVFDLSYALAQDYEMKHRLPITTYLADGFSSTGEKAVRFWGYEHLWRE